jgi:ribosome-binding ATPase
VLLLLNIGEGDVARAGELVGDFAARYRHRHTQVEALSGRIEMEIGQLEPEEGEVFRADLGLTESSLDRVIRLSYRLLGLISFFTAGPDETRAWTIPEGSTAVDAAGAIHSDLARGFIRAEIVSYEDLVELGSMAEARKQGKLRSEGKTHKVADGEVIEVLFNV